MCIAIVRVYRVTGETTFQSKAVVELNTPRAVETISAAETNFVRKAGWAETYGADFFSSIVVKITLAAAAVDDSLNRGL